MKAVFALVAIPRSAPDPLVYAVPPELAQAVTLGVRVRVPLRRRQATGMVVGLSETSNLGSSAVRDLGDVLDATPLLPDHVFNLATFVSSYYRCPLGTTLASMLPAGLMKADSETAAATIRGAAASLEALPELQAKLLGDVLERGPTPVAGLLARAGASSRTPLEHLELDGLITIRRSRRTRPKTRDVGAVVLAPGDRNAWLDLCARAPRQLEVIRHLAATEAPVLEAEVRAAVGCSTGVLRALEAKGVVRRFRQEASRRRRWKLPGDSIRHVLTDEQRAVVAAVETALANRAYAPILLEGVTGSGKTEVYLRCLEMVLQRGGQGVVLVPEIGLTPATVGAVEQRFGDQVSVLHSAQADGERWHEWLTVQSGKSKIVVGPRSALFAPLQELGLIVVDEEHDAAYKQQESPRYQARDLALVLGQRLRIPVLLCSATPSTEAAHLVHRKLARRLRLTERVGGGTLPEVELVDLRAEPADPGEKGRTLFSRRLKEGLAECLDSGHQAILLMQRRGWAPVLLCRDCGHTLQCPSCSVAMVVHKRRALLECHYCGHHIGRPKLCPTCAGHFLDPVGAGTEKVAHRCAQLFPDIATAILDRDTVRHRNGLENTLGAFASGRARVLVGTQLVAKGHHFPKVTLTAVISADALLGLPDFRAGERTFQLLTQLAGRSGRGGAPGKVIIQTYHPEHPAVLNAAKHDVAAFTTEEIRFRTAFGYPPMTRAALVRFESPSAEAVRAAAEAAGRCIHPELEGVRVRGPAPSPLERLRDRWRWQLLLTAPTRPPLRAALGRIETIVPPKNVRRVVDVDPLSTL